MRQLHAVKIIHPISIKIPVETTFKFKLWRTFKMKTHRRINMHSHQFKKRQILKNYPSYLEKLSFIPEEMTMDSVSFAFSNPFRFSS